MSSTRSERAARAQSHGNSRSISSVCGVRRSQSMKPMMHCALRPRRNIRSLVVTLAHAPKSSLRARPGGAVPSAASARGLRSRYRARSPARSRCSPATAIMAALSVQNSHPRVVDASTAAAAPRASGARAAHDWPRLRRPPPARRWPVCSSARSALAHSVHDRILNGAGHIGAALLVERLMRAPPA